MTRTHVLFVVLVAAAAAAPLVTPTYWLHVMIIAYFYALLSSSWSLLAGYAGQFSFGHAAFLAIGAYTSGLLTLHTSVSPPLGILIGALTATVAGMLIGVLCLRLRGAYLALFTIAFGEIVRVILNTEYQITRGALGLEVPPLFPGTSRIPYYYTMLGMLVLSLLVMGVLVNSRYGLFLRAIRDDEQAAASMGVDIVRYKIAAFVVTSFFAGLAGGFYGHYIGILTPDLALISLMGLIIAMAVIGGVESIIAAAFGAMAVEFGLEWLREFGAWRLVLFGGLLMLTLRFARNGLMTSVYTQITGQEHRPGQVRGPRVGAAVDGPDR